MCIDKNFNLQNLSNIQKTEMQNIAKLISMMNNENQKRLFFIVCSAVLNNSDDIFNN